MVEGERERERERSSIVRPGSLAPHPWHSADPGERARGDYSFIPFGSGGKRRCPKIGDTIQGLGH